MFKLIKDRPLWVHIVIAIVLAVIFFILFVFSLKLMTHHGSSRTVPLVVGKNIDEAERILDKEGFEMVIQDSVYVDTLPPLAVIRQIPESDAVVKVNRTVYVTVNRAMAPFIDMPNLVGYSFRNAYLTLQSVGLRFGDSSYSSDFARNSVLKQLYNGESIAAGTKIRMGSTIDLVLGTGVGERVFSVPELVGMRYEEAKAKVESYGISLIVLSATDVSDSSNAYIIQQEPRRFDDTGAPLKIRTGQVISVVLGPEKPTVDSLNNNQFPN